MRTVYITRREYFNAAHKLWNPEWSIEKNKEIFGKCSNENWHGHNYELFVTVKGHTDPQTGYIIDLRDLSILLKEKVTEVIDHKNINLDVPFMKGKMASTENLVLGIWDQIYSPIKDLGAELHCIKLYETENNYVEYFGE